MILQFQLTKAIFPTYPLFIKKLSRDIVKDILLKIFLLLLWFIFLTLVTWYTNTILVCLVIEIDINSRFKYITNVFLHNMKYKYKSFIKKYLFRDYKKYFTRNIFIITLIYIPRSNIMIWILY